MTCYMCDNEATSSEHVPPLCIFPAQKDVSDGKNYRVQLITVPSCEEHNGAKSQHDEYLFYMLTFMIQANELAKNQFRTKIMRSISRDKHLLRKITKETQSVKLVNELTGKVTETLAIKIDDEIFDSAIDCIARALYYDYFDKKWLTDIKVRTEFLFPSVTQEQTQKHYDGMAEIIKTADIMFQNSEFLGANPDIFKYQFFETKGCQDVAMRLFFYGGCKIFLMFSN